MSDQPSVVFELDTPAHVQEREIARMEAHSEVPSLQERQKVSDWLFDVAVDLLHDVPHVHVKVETAIGRDDVPFTVVSIMRQLYPPGHPGNMGELKRELFQP
jgi:hypothetical protein